MTLERAFFDVPCESRTAHDGPDRREQFGTVNFPDPVIRSR
jgi:hypothetical protein